jgi:hypothetical protein
MKRHALVLVLLALTAGCVATSLPPALPGPHGVVSGVVTSGGSPLPGVTVTLSDHGTAVRAAVSDAVERIAALGVAPGTYLVTISLQGFSELR